MPCSLDTKFCWSDQKPRLTSSILSKLVGCPGVLGGSKKPSKAKLLMPAHAAIVAILSGCCSPVTTGSAFQTGRRKRADGKQRHPTAAPALTQSFLEAQFSDFCSHFFHQKFVTLPSLTHTRLAHWHPECNLVGNVLKRIYTTVVCKLVVLGENRMSEHL